MLTIQRAALGDVAGIQQVLRETWIDTYAQYLAPSTLEEVSRMWRDTDRIAFRVQDPTIYFGVARIDDHCICGLVAAELKDEATLHIYRLYVHPKRQRQGIGGKLLETIVEQHPAAKKIVLQVLSQNSKGLAFWD